MKKRILLVARHFNALNGGIGKYAENVRDGVKKYYKSNASITCLESKHNNLLSYISLMLIRVPLHLLTNKHYDVCHATSPIESLWLPKDRTVVTFHDFMPVLSYSLTPVNILKRIAFRIALRKATKCKQIICVSDKTKKELHALYVVKAKKIKIIPNMVGDELSYAPYKKSKITKLGFIGKVDDPRKRVVEFIKMMKKIEDKNIEFHFVGIGDMFEQIKQAARDDRRIKIYGRISDSAKQKFFANLDLLFIPSKDEGFGIPIIEALKVGRPAVIFDDCTLPKKIKELCYTTPYSVKGIKAAIKKAHIALKNPKLAKQLSKKAEPYSINRIIKQIIQEYESIK